MTIEAMMAALDEDIATEAGYVVGLYLRETFNRSGMHRFMLNQGTCWAAAATDRLLDLVEADAGPAVADMTQAEKDRYIVRVSQAALAPMRARPHDAEEARRDPGGIAGHSLNWKQDVDHAG